MITIGIDPDLITIGTFIFSWHGLFSFVGVTIAVLWVAYWGPRFLGSRGERRPDKVKEEEERIRDMVYSTAVWAIIGGVIGARVVHVIDQWSELYRHNPGQIFSVWEGGIALYGAILGGLAAGVLYAYIKKYPITKLMDLTAPAMLLAQAVGRIGDVINGEHISRTTSMPWGVIWNNPKSPTFQKYGETATHPAVAYELIWDLVGFWVLWFILRGRIKPDGMLFVAYLAFYSFGRFLISFYREDKFWLIGLQQSQLISIIILAVTIPILAYVVRFIQREPEPKPAKASSTQKPPREV